VAAWRGMGGRRSNIDGFAGEIDVTIAAMFAAEKSLPPT
jgi:hypothetical protein